MKMEKVNGHGTIKKLRTGAVVSVLALSVAGIGCVVSADELTTSQGTATDVVITGEIEVTTDNVATAKAKADAAQAAANQAKADVDSAEQVLNDAQTNVKDLTEKQEDAQAIADQATPDNIAKAEDAVTVTTQAVSDAEQGVSDAQAKVDTDAQVVADAKKVTADAKADLDTAKQDQATIQDQIDNSDEAKVLDQYNKAVDAVDKDTKDVADLTQKVDASKQADAQNAQAVATAQADLAAKTQTATDSKAAYDQAVADQKVTASKVTTTKQKVDTIQSSIDSLPTINLSTEYVNTLKQYYVDYSADTSAKLTTLGASLYTSNTYSASSADKARTVNVNNLSYDIRLELTQMAVDLYNQIRTQMGYAANVKTTKVAIDAASGVADKRLADSWSVKAGHYNSAIKSTATDLGLTGLVENLYNAWGTGTETFANDATTVAELKSRVYDAVKLFMFKDAGSAWGHALSVSGVSYNDRYGAAMMNATTVNLGVDAVATDGTSIVFDMYSVRTSTVSVDGVNYSPTNTTVDNTEIANTNSYEALSAKLATARTDHAKAVTANTDALARVASTKAANDTAQQAKTDAQARLTSLQSYVSATAALEQKLVDAKAKLASDTVKRDNLADAVANLSTYIQNLQAQLVTAKQAVSTAQATYDTALANEQTAVNTYASSVEALEDAKTALADAQKAKIEAEDYLALLENADAVLAGITAQLIDASAKLDIAKREYGTAVATYSELKKNFDIRFAEYKALKDKYDVIIRDTKTPTPVTPLKVTKQAGVTQVGDKIIYSRVERSKALPNTGSQESLLGLLGASVLLGLGFGYVGKRVKGRN